MARMQADLSGKVWFDLGGEVWFLPSVADEARPTVTEIMAGIRLTPTVVASSPWLPDSPGALVWSIDFYMTLLRFDEDGSESDAWRTFAARRTTGFLVQSSDGGLSPGDRVAVYPVEAGHRRMLHAADALPRFEVRFVGVDEPALDATIVDA